MFRELSNPSKYYSMMIFFSAMAALFGIIATISTAGIIFVPFAVAFLAILFLFENPKTRFLSYITPAIIVAISAPFVGWYSLITVFYSSLSFIIVYLYVKCKSKTECAVYISVLFFLGIVAHIFAGLVSSVGTLDFSLIEKQFLAVVEETKGEIIDLIYSRVNQMDNTTDAVDIYEALVLSVNSYFQLIPAIIAIISFLLTGIALKTFSFITRKTCKNGILKSFLNFLPTNIVAFSYIILAVIALLLQGNDVASLAILNIYNLLMIVFAYMGLKYVQVLAYSTGRRTFVYTACAFALLFMTSTAVIVLSFLGVYITFAANKGIKNSKTSE